MWPQQRVYSTQVALAPGHDIVWFGGIEGVVNVAVVVGGVNHMLLPMAPGDLRAVPQVSGIPTYYALMDTGQLRLWPVPDAAYLMSATYVLDSVILPVSPAWRQEYEREFRERGGKC